MIFKSQSYTVADYEAFAVEHPNQRFELIDGEIVERFPSQRDGAVVSLLGGFLCEFLYPKSIGYALLKASYALTDDPFNSFVIDVSFITKDKGKLLDEGAAPYMPDLAVEVQSPGQSDRFMANKAAYYLAHGSRMVWLVYPRARLVEVLTKEDRQLLTATDILNGGSVLPEFQVAVKDIFPAQNERD
jgi:Uma2 family endonuclease